jgi:putative transposase
VTYDIRSKELKHAEEENRILRKLLSNKDIELEVQRELLKKSLGHQIQERFSRYYF